MKKEYPLFEFNIEKINAYLYKLKTPKEKSNYLDYLREQYKLTHTPTYEIPEYDKEKHGDRETYLSELVDEYDWLLSCFDRYEKVFKKKKDSFNRTDRKIARQHSNLIVRMKLIERIKELYEFLIKNGRSGLEKPEIPKRFKESLEKAYFSQPGRPPIITKEILLEIPILRKKNPALSITNIYAKISKNGFEESTIRKWFSNNLIYLPNIDKLRPKRDAEIVLNLSKEDIEVLWDNYQSSK